MHVQQRVELQQNNPIKAAFYRPMMLQWTSDKEPSHNTNNKAFKAPKIF